MTTQHLQRQLICLSHLGSFLEQSLFPAHISFIANYAALSRSTFSVFSFESQLSLEMYRNWFRNALTALLSSQKQCNFGFKQCDIKHQSFLRDKALAHLNNFSIRTHFHNNMNKSRFSFLRLEMLSLWCFSRWPGSWKKIKFTHRRHLIPQTFESNWTARGNPKTAANVWLLASIQPVFCTFFWISKLIASPWDM